MSSSSNNSLERDTQWGPRPPLGALFRDLSRRMCGCEDVVQVVFEESHQIPLKQTRIEIVKQIKSLEEFAFVVLTIY